jgi:hypothetical protein
MELTKIVVLHISSMLVSFYQDCTRTALVQAAFRKFYGCYNDLLCQYSQMLFDVFYTNR